ncbi:MAG TPA: 5-amino-6-(D-ribitylamino)uracil--L-tyrosine 4-hydroxyphenyl transferase CofH [Methanoregulaceae archaeon]|nr:5-amino-6-(D-ribitylamino)uracil--L-tyrosine 4-hydroxyphenyl transferase CofH [Methanoregulaceae archaeon]HOV66915.1 5-amino-6-(D-ribitylamino)uracil--L-tyrosine 4-hydroxyphenyl transferase CofH [Methanoregulaceae archaeon]HQJ88135.1 5-amino-6-(D-ribitylamino)uracil--L-tyrosine 4-hydroxyphenyl transferase CofH [Methanoregulaceae archaeon]
MAYIAGSARITTLLSDCIEGYRLTEGEAALLLRAEGPDVLAVAAAADRVREERVGETVTWVRNQNINVTNVCINRCGFCGFSRRPGDPDAFRLSHDAVVRKAREAAGRRVTEICTVSGLAPDFDGDAYCAILRACREGAPGVHLHASNPMEVAYGAERSGRTTEEQLLLMREAGLGSLCGTAAEILVDEVRARICPGKCSSAEWARIIIEAHRLGIPTTATIMYGSGETVGDRARHLAILREIQDETGGFTEFVPLSFIHHQTPLYRAGRAPPGATGREDLLMIAVARLFFDNIDHIQASWVKLGVKMAGLMLLAGADDLGGTMFEERISAGAGATGTDYLAPEEMARIAADLGRPFAQRTTLYERVNPA